MKRTGTVIPAHHGAIIRTLGTLLSPTSPATWLLTALLLAPSAGQAQVLRETRAEVLRLPVDTLPALAGEQPAALELARYADGEFQSVAHQWVLWSAGHQPYFANDEDAKRQAPVSRLAANDRLLVRREDAGERLDGPAPPNLIAELPVGQGERRRYFYVLARPPFQGFAPAVTLQRSPLAIRTDHYQLTFNDNNLFLWGDFLYRDYRPPPGHGATLLDSLKLRLSAGIFSASARLTLTNENLDPIIRQVIEGPLATLIYATTKVRVAGLALLTVHNYFIFMDNAIAVHSRLTLPGIAAAVLREPSARVTVDGNALDGARLRTSWTGELEAIVDGQLSPQEKSMIERPVAADNRLWFSTGRGFDLQARLRFVEGFDTAIRFIYQDDPELADPPERFPGQRPNVGFRLDGIPFGHEFYFIAELRFSNGEDGAP